MWVACKIHVAIAARKPRNAAPTSSTAFIASWMFLLVCFALSSSLSMAAADTIHLSPTATKRWDGTSLPPTGFCSYDSPCRLPPIASVDLPSPCKLDLLLQKGDYDDSMWSFKCSVVDISYESFGRLELTIDANTSSSLTRLRTTSTITNSIINSRMGKSTGLLVAAEGSTFNLASQETFSPILSTFTNSILNISSGGMVLINKNKLFNSSLILTMLKDSSVILQESEFTSSSIDISTLGGIRISDTRLVKSKAFRINGGGTIDIKDSHFQFDQLAKSPIAFSHLLTRFSTEGSTFASSGPARVTIPSKRALFTTTNFDDFAITVQCNDSVTLKTVQFNYNNPGRNAIFNTPSMEISNVAFSNPGRLQDTFFGLQWSDAIDMSSSSQFQVSDLTIIDSPSVKIGEIEVTQSLSSLASNGSVISPSPHANWKLRSIDMTKVTLQLDEPRQSNFTYIPSIFCRGIASPNPLPQISSISIEWPLGAPNPISDTAYPIGRFNLETPLPRLFPEARFPFKLTFADDGNHLTQTLNFYLGDGAPSLECVEPPPISPPSPPPVAPPVTPPPPPSPPVSPPPSPPGPICRAPPHFLCRGDGSIYSPVDVNASSITFPPGAHVIEVDGQVRSSGSIKFVGLGTILKATGCVSAASGFILDMSTTSVPFSGRYVLIQQGRGCSKIESVSLVLPPRKGCEKVTFKYDGQSARDIEFAVTFGRDRSGCDKKGIIIAVSLGAAAVVAIIAFGIVYKYVLPRFSGNRKILDEQGNMKEYHSTND